MKMRSILSAFLAAICIFGFCTLGIFAEDANDVYATTSTSITQGSYGYCYVYLDDLTDLSALTVSVHYDAAKVTVKNSYNKVACQVYDSSSKDGCLQFSYVLDGKGSNTKTQLFYFRYQVNSTAAAGDTYFDIVVDDAYNAGLEAMNIGGSRCQFTVTEKAVSQSCSVSSSATVSTAVKEEFTLSYRLSTYKVASGSFKIQYDPELFEVVEVTKGAFLDNKIADVNANLDGAIAVSFAGTTYNSKYDLITVKFRTIKNVGESTNIKFNVTDLYDLNLSPYTCTGYTSKVNVVFDETYTEDCPAVYLSSVFDKKTGNIVLTVNLEKDSHLGAGDFVLNFDLEKLTYVSSEKGFTPTIFNINEKNVANGVLKFSILSMTDITNAETVLTATFEPKDGSENQIIAFEITGNGLTDAMTDTIMLNFVGTSVTIPTPGNVIGDIDSDGVVSVKDVLASIKAVLNGTTLDGADMNGDGKLTLIDVIRILKAITA